VSALFGQTSRCSASSAGPRYFSVTATQPQASQAISRSAAFTARRVRAASPAGQSCSSNSRSAQRSEGRSQRRPQTPHDATPGLSSASSASSRRFALPQATGRLYRRGRGRPRRAPRTIPHAREGSPAHQTRRQRSGDSSTRSRHLDSRARRRMRSSARSWAMPSVAGHLERDPLRRVALIRIALSLLFRGAGLTVKAGR
jgi:hypothetical protein